jgi:hypothetical protein
LSENDTRVQLIISASGQTFIQGLSSARKWDNFAERMKERKKERKKVRKKEEKEEKEEKKKEMK